VSNLTNLIAVHALDIGAHDFIATFLAPTVVACTAGYWAWRFAFRASELVPPANGMVRAVDRRPLAIGASVLVALLAGFLLGDAAGVAPWVVVARPPRSRQVTPAVAEAVTGAARA